MAGNDHTVKTHRVPTIGRKNPKGQFGQVGIGLKAVKLHAIGAKTNLAFVQSEASFIQARPTFTKTIIDF